APPSAPPGAVADRSRRAYIDVLAPERVGSTGRSTRAPTSAAVPATAVESAPTSACSAVACRSAPLPSRLALRTTSRPLARRTPCRDQRLSAKTTPTRTSRVGRDREGSIPRYQPALCLERFDEARYRP